MNIHVKKGGLDHKKHQLASKMAKSIDSATSHNAASKMQDRFKYKLKYGKEGTGLSKGLPF